MKDEAGAPYGGTPASLSVGVVLGCCSSGLCLVTVRWHESFPGHELIKVLGRGINVVQRRDLAEFIPPALTTCRRLTVTDHGAATRAHGATVAGTRQTQPTKTPTFPHQHTEKSPLQQHVVSYDPKTNTFCPLTPRSGSRIACECLGVLRCLLAVRMVRGGKGSDHPDTKDRRSEDHRSSVRHGGLEPSTR